MSTKEKGKSEQKLRVCEEERVCMDSPTRHRVRKVHTNVQGSYVWLCWKNTMILRCKGKKVHMVHRGHTEKNTWINMNCASRKDMTTC